MFSCCALFSQTEDPADVEHLKALDVSGAGETGPACRCCSRRGRHFSLLSDRGGQLLATTEKKNTNPRRARSEGKHNDKACVATIPFCCLRPGYPCSLRTEPVPSLLAR